MIPDGRWCSRTIVGPSDVTMVVQLLEDGERLPVVARRREVSPSVVSRLWKKLPGDWRVHQEQGQNRSRMTTSKKDRFLILLSIRNRIRTARTLEIDFRRATYVHLPDQNVRN